MTAVHSPLTLDEGRDTFPDDAYTEFWHAMEDDGVVSSFDEDEGEHEADANDPYFEFVSSIEA